MNTETTINYEQYVNKGQTYAEYRQMIDELLAEGKTTGENQSDAYIHYATLNQHRMQRWEKRTILTDELVSAMSTITKRQTWLVITEGWCGDAAHNVPIMSLAADLNDQVNLRVVLRDENLELMDAHLTNGGRSIPKLIVLDENHQVINEWGPRPAPVQQMVLDYKAMEDKPSYDDFQKEVQMWYIRDKSVTMQKELTDFVNELR